MATSYTYGLICIPEKLKEQNKPLAFQTMTRIRFNELNEQYDSGKSVVVAQDILEKRILHNLPFLKIVAPMTFITIDFPQSCFRWSRTQL